MIALLPVLPCSLDLTIDRGIADLTPTITSSALRDRAQNLLRRKPDLIRDRLRFLLRHPDHLRRIAENSYFHNNGFFKIRVVRTLDFGVRLHVWPAGPDRLGDTDPHGHRWVFASWIAAGQGVEETSFVEVSRSCLRSGSSAREYTRYEYGRGPVTGWLRSTRAAVLQPVDVREHHVGQVYHCPLTTVHTVSPTGSGLVATIVLQGPTLRHSAAVYSRSGRPVAPTETTITVRTLTEVLSQVEAELDTAVAAGEPNPPAIFLPAVAASARNLAMKQPLSPGPHHVTWMSPDTVFKGRRGVERHDGGMFAGLRSRRTRGRGTTASRFAGVAALVARIHPRRRQMAR